jgi:hypothetical protein
VEVHAEASVVVPRPLGDVFDFAVAPESQPLLLQASPPIPGVTSIEMLDGAVLETGARRRVQLSDGSTLREEVIALDRPRRHAYRWLDRPAFPLDWLVRSAIGDWTFSGDESRTRVDWSYTFTLTSPLAWPLASAVAWLFQRWMQQSLERIASAMPPAAAARA